MERPSSSSLLEGVRVLDLSNLLAGPMSTMFLADLGADVVKVEVPSKGDEFRRWGQSKNGVGLFFKVINRNKRLITLDLHDSRGQDLARRLAASSDVVVENFRPGTLERWGLGYRDLSESHPGLIMARITGFGQTGPKASEPGFGTLAEGFSGCAYTLGFGDRPPLLPSFGLGDMSTALCTAYGIMAALFHREVSGGQGQYIDLALYETLFTLMGPHVVDYQQLGIVAERGHQAQVAPRNSYQTRDGVWVAIAGSTQRTFEKIVRALDVPDLADDPRYVDNAARVKNVQTLDRALQDAVGRFDYAQLSATFAAAGATLAPELNIEQIFREPQYAARENIARVADAELGTMAMQNVIPHFSRNPGRIRHAAQKKGESNRDVFLGELGLNEDAYRALVEDGVI